MEHKPAPPLATFSGTTILQVIPDLDAGGAERTTQEVAQAIVAAGGRSIVVSQGGRLVPQIEREGSIHITMPVASKSPWQIWKNRRSLATLMRREGVNLVHARSRAPAWSALWAAKAESVPFVTTYHGIYNAKSAPKRLYNSAMARADRVIANSNFTAAAVRDSFAGAGFFDPARIVVIPRGADLVRFNPDELDSARRARAASAFGAGDGLRILLPGRLTSWKGQAVLIEAARLLHQAKDSFAFRVILVGSAQGRDGYEAELKKQIEDAGLTQHIAILDHWDDMPAAYDWADLTLSTSTRPEAFGRVAIEAQAMACPVIASAHGGALETVVDNVTGMLVAPGDSDALAAAIARFEAKDADERIRMGEAGRDRVRADFSTETMTSATLSVYMSLTNKTGSKPREVI